MTYVQYTIKHKPLLLQMLNCDVAEWLKMRNMGGKKGAIPGIEPSTKTNQESMA